MALYRCTLIASEKETLEWGLIISDDMHLPWQFDTYSITRPHCRTARFALVAGLLVRTEAYPYINKSWEIKKIPAILAPPTNQKPKI